MLLLLYWVQLFYMACKLELGRGPPGIICQAVVVNALVRKWNVAFLEELLPANLLGPLTYTLVLLSIFGIYFKDILDCINNLRPTWRIVGQKRNNKLGEFWRRPGVGYLAANQNGNAVTFRVSQRHRRAHGVAVTAEHTTSLINRDTLYLFTGSVDAFGRLNSSERAGGDSQG